MAHFAQIDENNIVQQIIVVANSDCGNLEFPDSESIGQDFLKSIRLNGTWKQTSYSGSFRKNYAGIEYSYDESRDSFIPIKPYDSWILNETSCRWESPIPIPNQESMFVWDEENQRWNEINTTDEQK
jgi:hypothetical protein